MNILKFIKIIALIQPVVACRFRCCNYVVRILTFVGNCEFIEALLRLDSDVAIMMFQMLQLYFENLSFVGNCEFIEALLRLDSDVAIIF